MGFRRQGRTDVYSFTPEDLARMRAFYTEADLDFKRKRKMVIDLVVMRRGCRRNAATGWVQRRIEKGMSLEEIANEAIKQ